ncbi:hypothetical protein HPB50_002275 [Hyalomma asiaticum]|uniref:Uncharacterized protein n=1 Tax=Hyalomma asiaticum TaxID=266040 RepID=A0ACB7TDJ9_HYAAI|nr:hypothetical protein HPB50_002275 [Hyalomma asiaticum]
MDAPGDGPSNVIANTATFPPNHYTVQTNTRPTAYGNRHRANGFKRQQAQAHRPPPSSSSSSGGGLAQRRPFRQRRTRDRSRKHKSRLAMPTPRLKTAVYGESATPQPRADSSEDDGGDYEGWFEKDIKTNTTQRNQDCTPTPLGAGNFWYEDDLECADRARRLSTSTGPIFETPCAQNSERHPKSYQQTDVPNIQVYDEGRDEGWRRGGNNGRQVTYRESNVAPFAHMAETANEECDRDQDLFAVQEASQGCLLPRNYKAGVHFYNESDRLYYERSMAKRIEATRLPEEYSDESEEPNWKHILAASIDLPDDPRRTERWVHTHYPFTAQPIHAESAADPVLIFGEATSPNQEAEIRKSQGKGAPYNRANKLPQKFPADAFVDTSSEGSSPPLDRKQIPLVSCYVSPSHQTVMRSYKEIMKEEKAKQAALYSPINEPSRYQKNHACCNNSEGENQANEARFLEVGGRGTHVERGTEFGHDMFVHGGIFEHGTSNNCEPQTSAKCQVHGRKEETMPSNAFHCSLKHVCGGAHPKYTYQIRDFNVEGTSTSKNVRNRGVVCICSDHLAMEGRRNETCDRECCQYVRDGSGDQTLPPEEFKLVSSQRIRPEVFGKAGKLASATGEEKAQFYCGEGTFTKSSSQMTGNQEIGGICPDLLRTVVRQNEICERKYYQRIQDKIADQTFPSDKLNLAPRRLTRAAISGNAEKLADAPGEEKTQFYSCSSRLSEQRGELASNYDDFWSPVSLLLPELPRRRTQDITEILRSIRSDWFYTDDMAIVPTLQNKTSYNLMLTGGISHRFPTNYLDGSAVILYHPRNQAWFFFGTMPEPRCYHTTVLVGGSIIVAGECCPNCPHTRATANHPFSTRGLDPLNVTSSGRMQPSSKAFFFSIQKQRWYYLANMRCERAFHAAVGWSDCVIVFGGIGLTGFAEIYSIKTNQWTLVHPMPKGLMGMAAVTVDNSIWIFGGVSRDSGGSSIEDATYVFDPRTDTWTTRSPMAMKRAFCSAVSVQRDIWLVGGIVNLRPLECTDRIDVLRVEHDSWEPYAALPLPMHSVRVVKTGSEVYMVGGQTVFNKPREEVIVFNRVHRRLFKCTETPKDLVGFAAVLLPRHRSPLSSSRATPQERWYAATVIQRAYRQYRNDGTLRFYFKNASTSPLMLAASGGHLRVAQMLMDHGADPNQQNFHGKTALDIATACSNMEVAEYLRNVIDILRRLGLDKYAENFEENEVGPGALALP